jgi:drug/metabolite transporter (DMT)-like permease
VDAGLSPAFVAWSRIALAALLVVPLAVRRGALRGLGGRWLAIAGYAACEIAVPFVLIASGEQYISSSLTAILIATMPLMVALLSVQLSPTDRPTGRRLVGLAIGLGGVVALLVPFQLDGEWHLGSAEKVGTALAWTSAAGRTSCSGLDSCWWRRSGTRRRRSSSAAAWPTSTPSALWR